MDTTGLFSILFLKQIATKGLLEKPSLSCTIKFNFWLQTQNDFLSSTPFCHVKFFFCMQHVVQNCTSIYTEFYFPLILEGFPPPQAADENRSGKHPVNTLLLSLHTLSVIWCFHQFIKDREKSLDDKKEELVGKNSYGFIYGLTRESEDNIHRLFADMIFVYLGPQSIA